MSFSPRLLSLLLFLLSATTLFAVNSSNNVTVSEYTKFLNVVAQEDRHTLYDQKMGEESGVASIERFGVPGNYSYRFNEEQAGESVLYVDLRSAMRFCNWKENGEQEDPATTEHGVYELDGDQLVSVNIDDTTNYFLPSEQDGKFSSMEGVCLRSGLLEDPASWLRSNQVVFHLKGRLENMAVALSHEEQTSLEKDAGYVLGTLAGIAAVATAWKYRDRCYPGRAGYERIPDAEVERRRRDVTDGRPGGEEDASSLVQRGYSLHLHVQESASSSQLSAPEPREKLLHVEAQTLINQEITPRMERINRFQHESPKYVDFMKTSFENIFQFRQRTQDLGALMEPYMEKLDQAWKNTTSPTMIRRAVSLINDRLAREHANIMTAARNYCSDFDASWANAREAAQKQHDCWIELQNKENWINTTFPDLVRVKGEGINYSLNEGAVGEVKTLRTGSIKKFFDTTFRKEFETDQRDMVTLAEVAKAKFPGWWQQVEELRFWDAALSERATQCAQELVQLADAETETLLNAYHVWEDKTERVMTRAGQRYDAVNHHIPPYSEGKTRMSEADHALMIKAVDHVNLQHEVESFYPPKEQEEVYLKTWVEAQYNRIAEVLKQQRGYFSLFSLSTYTSPLKGTLPESEKEILRYFLTIVASSPVDFIREKAVALQHALDPDLDESESSESNNSDLSSSGSF